MIVIPMAGLSSRFFKAGYSKPKYMLEAKGKTLFEYSVESFSEYFNKEHFVFIVRDVYGTVSFVNDKCKLLGIKSYEVFLLHQESRGQADTVGIALKNINYNLDESLIIFNIDTFRLNFSIKEKLQGVDGYLEVFLGGGDNWSYVKKSDEDSEKVVLTTEKKPISNLCSNGLYYFSKIIYFLESYDEYLKKDESEWSGGELYVAPLYNCLIERGLYISYKIIDESDIVFCGTPKEYEEFLLK